MPTDTTYTDKIKAAKNRSVANAVAQKQSRSRPALQWIDNRPESPVQRMLWERTTQLQDLEEEPAQLQGLEEEEPAQMQGPEEEEPAQLQGLEEEEPIQQKTSAEHSRGKNNTGMPDPLKAGVEHLSGYAMDDVKVHYNSAKPAQLNAHAYAQGTDIHIAPGQERHLPHEAWHVVQQKQGRVQPTLQMEDGVSVNTDKGLEKEADLMGAKALQMKGETLEEEAD